MDKNNEFQFTIESGKTERHYWMDLWRYRELFYILAWRDIAVQYKQTIMGVLWAVVRPLLTMISFVVVFGSGLFIASLNLKVYATIYDALF
jgi:lipopolysaccharide transport system permease protein